MILTVSHITTYSYESPVRGAVQSIRATPSVFDGQRVLSWQIEVPGGIRGAAFRDGAGDWVESWSLRGPASEIEVRVRGEVETADLSGVLRGHRETLSPEAYLRETGPTRADTALTELAQAAAKGAGGALDTAHRISAAVAEAIVYRPGATAAHTAARTMPMR